MIMIMVHELSEMNEQWCSVNVNVNVNVRGGRRGWRTAYHPMAWHGIGMGMGIGKGTGDAHFGFGHGQMQRCKR